MPIYEYKCSNCNAEIEIFQNMNEPAPGCAHCMVTMKRQIGTGQLVRFGRRNSYQRKGYSNKNVILSGSDGYRVMKQSRYGKGQVRDSASVATQRGEARFES